MATWRELIGKEMAEHGETFDDAVGTALAPNTRWRYLDENEKPTLSLDTEFHDGFGGSNGCLFTIWTAKRVYFPIVYDGAEWAGSVPRHPCDEASPHMGGE